MLVQVASVITSHVPSSCSVVSIVSCLVFPQAHLYCVIDLNPDLIITPECCNRVGEWTSAQKQDFYRIYGDEFMQMMSDFAKEHKVNLAYACGRYVEEDKDTFEGNATLPFLFSFVLTESFSFLAFCKSR